VMGGRSGGSDHNGLAPSSAFKYAPGASRSQAAPWAGALARGVQCVCVRDACGEGATHWSRREERKPEALVGCR
jgi:hypothetical protein